MCANKRFPFNFSPTKIFRTRGIVRISFKFTFVLLYQVKTQLYIYVPRFCRKSNCKSLIFISLCVKIDRM